MLSYCEMLLVFRDPPPEALIPSMLKSGALGGAIPVFDRAFQIGAACSSSELRHRLKSYIPGLPYACGVLRPETFLIDRGAGG